MTHPVVGRTLAGRPVATSGALDARRFVVVVARWNELVTERLLAGALDALSRHGCPDGSVDVVWVPGALEVPLAARAAAATGRYAAVIALGAVIRGATGHYDVVAGQSAAGLVRVALDTGVPVLDGILTTDTIEQAIERAGTKAGNKGAEAAVAALELADVLARLGADDATGA